MSPLNGIVSILLLFSTACISMSIPPIPFPPGMFPPPLMETGMGQGIGWANATGQIVGGAGTVTATAVSSSNSTIIIGEDGHVQLVTANGDGTGTAEGTVESQSSGPVNVGINLTGNGGGQATAQINKTTTYTTQNFNL